MRMLCEHNLFVLLSPAKAGQVDTKEPPPDCRAGKSQAETYYPEAAAGIFDLHVSAGAPD